MTVQYRTPPNYVEPLIEGNNTSSAYYRFFQDLDIGIPPSAEVTVIPTGSPFTYTPPMSGHAGFMLITGGTVSKVQIMRESAHDTGMTSGIFPLSIGDQLIVTYSGAPTMVYITR